jgi:hypothetical protein
VDKLKALGAALDSINGRLAGIGTIASFKRTRAQLEQWLRPLGQGTRKIIPVKELAAAGIPDVRDWEAYITNWLSRSRRCGESFFLGGSAAWPGCTNAMSQTPSQVLNRRKFMITFSLGLPGL